MNRHHPYGGYDQQPRRGHGGTGPERTGRFPERSGHRGRGGGRGGGRGMGSMAHPDNQAYHPSGPYNYPDEPVYAQSYPESYGAYDQPPYGAFEATGEPKSSRPPPRREDPAVREHLIEQRIQRERPCRTLFIRNVKYETSSSFVRGMFEEHGEIKTFFDLISSRGMVFVTYFDIRAAERARDRLQGAELSGRPIDVHYSLPRAEEQTGECNRDKNQGTLLVTLQHGGRQGIDEVELRRKFSQTGDIKSLKPVDYRPDQRYLEYYDTRACGEAFDSFQGDRMQDGTLELAFEWDAHDQSFAGGQAPPGSREDRFSRNDEHPNPRGRGGGRGRGRGGDRGRGRGRGGGRGGPPPPPPPAWEEPNFRQRYNEDKLDTNPPPSNGFDAGKSDIPDEERFAQARQVQQLLAALKQPGPQTHSEPAKYPAAYPPPIPQPPMEAQSAYYPPLSGQGGPPYSGAPGYFPTTQGPVPPPANLGAFPPNIMQLLQQGQQPGQGPSSSPSGYGTQGYPPPPTNTLSPPPPNAPGGGPAFQQLMSLLSQSQPGTSK